MICVTLLTLGMTLGFAVERGQAAGMAMSSSTVDSSGDTGYSANILVSQDGALHAVYFDKGAGKVKYRRRLPPAVWGAAEVVGDARDPSYLSAAVGPDGSVHLAFFSNAAPCSGACHARRSPAGVWTVDSVDAAVPNSSFTAVAVDALARPHVAYGGADGELKYGLFNGTAWSVSTLDSSANMFSGLGGDSSHFRRVSLALDPANRPVIAYFDEGSSALRYLAHDGASWLAAETALSPQRTPAALSLAFNGSGEPVIGVLLFGPGALLSVSKSGGAWSSSEAVANGTAPDPAVGMAFALDGAGRGHFAFSDDSNGNGDPAAAYAFFDGVSWSTQTVDDASGGAYSVGLALDGSGSPHLLYADPNAANPELKYSSATAAGFSGPIKGGPGSLLGAATGFMSTAVYLTSVTWTWTDNSTNETGFRLYGSLSPAGPFALAASVGAGVNVYTETGLVHGTSYYRYAAAFNAGGVAFSSASSAWTFPAETATASGASGQTVTYAAPDGPVTVSIPEGAFPGEVAVSFSVPQAFPSGASELASLSPPTGVEITVSGGLQPRREVLITVGYSDASVQGLDETKLVLARYDEPARVWVPLKSVPEPDLNRVTGRTNHFSAFQVMAAGDSTGLSFVRAFPNPLRPSKGHVSMTFDRLPPGALVRVLAFSGEKVRDYTADLAGMASWDGTNSKGEKVGTGAYFVFIESAGRRRTLKVAVQR
ncbi:MAG: hypothetical protein WC943_11025 [Elusimicrobiota bacterium]